MIVSEVAVSAVVPSDFVPDAEFFGSLRSYGSASVALRIGPLHLSMDGLSGRQVEDLRVRFRPFVVEEGGSPDLRIELRPAGRESFLRNPPIGTREWYRLHRYATAQGTVTCSYEFAGIRETSGRKALLALVQPEGPLFDRGLENFLRVLTASFILESGGFLLHASGVVRNGAAYVFFGPSGSGKTTITLLSPDDVVLSDDLTLVVRTDRGYEAAGIPFGMAHHTVPQTRESFPIRCFNRLVQSQEVKREPIPGSRALAEVASCLPFVMQETAEADRAVGAVARALREIQVYTLHFRKDPSFWDVVEEG